MARYGKRNSTKFVFTKELGILLGLIVALIVATVLLSIPNRTDRSIEKYNEAITEFNTVNQTQHATITTEDVVYEDAEYEDFEEILSGEGTVYILYGTLSLESIVSNFVTINTEAENREIEKIYFLSSEYVDTFEDDLENDDDEDIFEATVEGYEKDIFNKNVLEGVEEVDLMKSGALLVYKNGQLVFNSTSYTDYNWTQIINQAFQK
jgi:hypothetical protein